MPNIVQIEIIFDVCFDYHEKDSEKSHFSIEMNHNLDMCYIFVCGLI